MRSGGRCWRFNGCSELGAEAICSGELAVVANTVGVGGEGVHYGESRIRIVEVSAHIMIHGSCRCPCYPGVSIGCSWIHDVSIVSGVSSRGTSGQG